MAAVENAIRAEVGAHIVVQVMRHVAEGLVAFLLERHDHGKPILRAASRELLSSCVLRSIMTFFTPFTANKARAPLPLTLMMRMKDKKISRYKYMAVKCVASPPVSSMAGMYCPTAIHR